MLTLKKTGSFDLCLDATQNSMSLCNSHNDIVQQNCNPNTIEHATLLYYITQNTTCAMIISHNLICALGYRKL